MAERFLRHLKMTAWGTGIVLEERGGQMTVLWADGNRRTFKVAAIAKLVEEFVPESEEERETLLRAKASGGTRTQAVNFELESQLRAGFEDPAPFLVYADWLMQKEDPRGALIHAQHRGVAKHEKAVMKDHAEVLIPPGFTKKGNYALTWKLGFIAAARVGNLANLDEALAVLLAHPSTALIAELVLHGSDYRGSPLDIIARQALSVRKLVLGGELSTNTWATGNIAGVFELPRLVELEVTADRVYAAGTLAHPKLERLSVLSRRGDPSTERVLTSLDAPALTAFSFSCADGIDPPPLTPFAKLPAIRALTLTNTTSTRAWIEKIMEAPCATTLVELALRDGDFDDNDARWLASKKAAFPALELLDLTGNRVGPELEAFLGTFAPTVHATGLPRDRWRTARVRAIPAITDAARQIAQVRRFEELGIDAPRDRIWGRYLGTTGIYDVAVERGSEWSACSCPSNERPCKHALALHVLNAAGSIAEGAPPYQHYERAERKRYGSSWE
jgi:uncharacterized protein (TIGR02996 family)